MEIVNFSLLNGFLSIPIVVKTINDSKSLKKSEWKIAPESGHFQLSLN